MSLEKIFVKDDSDIIEHNGVKIVPFGLPRLLGYNGREEDLNHELEKGKPKGAIAYTLGGARHYPSFDDRVSPEITIAVQYFGLEHK